jgi:hypothetical protein
MNEFTFDELEAQRAELLPARETLFTLNVFELDFDVNAALVEATNTSQAINAVTEDSAAYSAALQDINIEQ